MPTWAFCATLLLEVGVYLGPGQQGDGVPKVSQVDKSSLWKATFRWPSQKD